ncbi:unnamed protein product [Polarella glacialis]|uniref:Uncharacterized protein n=1 Tax=Polarella glacialis TaxID=89957 RepID=A0A813KMT6_POLGL|nr:unnamed protein product [Polarella glacialis]
MAMRMSVLRVMASSGKAAPKPKFSSRTGGTGGAASTQAPPPVAQPPPPAPAAASYGSSQGAGAQPQGGGGGLGYQILLGVGSMFGVVMAMQLVSRLFGPRSVTVTHKDSSGNVIERSTGKWGASY